MARVLIVVSVHVEKKIISCHRFVSSLCCFDVHYNYCDISGKMKGDMSMDMKCYRDITENRSDRFGKNNSSVKMRQE